MFSSFWFGFRFLIQNTNTITI